MTADKNNTIKAKRHENLSSVDNVNDKGLTRVSSRLRQDKYPPMRVPSCGGYRFFPQWSAVS